VVLLSTSLFEWCQWLQHTLLATTINESRLAVPCDRRQSHSDPSDIGDLRVIAAEVSTSPAFHTGSSKLLFKLPGPLSGNLGNMKSDGQQFVFAINVPAARAEP
jgi:hypothetical protein